MTNETTFDSEGYIAASEACRMLGISLSTLIRYRKRGLIAATQLPSGHHRYSLTALREFQAKGGVR